MRSRTPQRARQERLYLARRALFLAANPTCAGYGKVEGCRGRADTIQHLKGRRGGLLLEERFWLALCWSPCHSFAELNPHEAVRLGLRLPRVGDAA